MSFGWLLEAEYESGYVHRENEQDESSYKPGHNFFYDILSGMPTENGQGRMVRFSLIPAGNAGEGYRYDIDWRLLPANARPVHFMRMSITTGPAGSTGPVCQTRGFGYQYTDEDGKNVEKIEEIIN